MHKVSTIVYSSAISILTEVYTVAPAHLAFVLLNESGGDPSMPGGPPAQSSSPPLFASVVSRAGGDPVSMHAVFKTAVF